MADRYWVGGSGTWNTTSTTNWSASSGGASGASVPTSADNVFFDQAGTYTVTCTGALNCANWTVSAGTVTFANGTSPTFNIYGSLSVIAGTVWSSTGAVTLRSTSASTIVTNGVTVTSAVSIFTATGSYTLGSAFTSGGAFTVTQGTFDTAGYSFTASSFVSTNNATRSISLGASLVTLSASGNVINFGNAGTLTFDAGTSSITLTSSAAITPTGGGFTFYGITITASSSATLNGIPTINTLTPSARSSAATRSVFFTQDVTIDTLTIGTAADAARRLLLFSNTIGATRTLTVSTFTAGATDVDFRDIAIAGTAAPISGTRFGDCKGNSGITFPAGANKYWNLAAGGNITSSAWATTSGGSASLANFPLAQDTIIFEATGLNSGATVTVNSGYNLGTIDMSARTSNTMTLATGTTAPGIYGNWINGTGATLTGTGTLTFAGRNAQTITSAGKTFTATVTVDSPGGTVTLQDAFTSSRAASGAITVTSGTFDANGYNVTLSAGGFVSTSGTTRTVGIGSGTWTIGVSGTAWNCSSTNLTVTGTGVISLTSVSAKTFTGGGVQTYPTLNQGGTGQLTVGNSNKFANITNTAIGTVRFTGGTTNEFTAFNLNGAVGTPLTLGSSNTTQAILKKPSTWYMGANSTDAGNNTGLTFTAGGGIDYLTVSYINGTVAAGNYTITANNGTYAVSGQTASITMGRLFVADAGQYALNGQDAIITLGGSPIVVSDQLLIKLRSFTERRSF